MPNAEERETVAYGSLEGTLRGVSTCYPSQCVIYDRFTGSPVQCFLGDEHLDQAKAMFITRVRVYGLIRYDADGCPKSIEIDRPIEWLRGRTDLPQASDIEGVDITVGVDSAEYVRRLRDA